MPAASEPVGRVSRCGVGRSLEKLTRSRMMRAEEFLAGTYGNESTVVPQRDPIADV